jgi:ABC-type polysaccharide/polyol phosphate export permease
LKWKGDYLFVLRNLVLKDFRIRYRNMSLGVLWSLLNPLVMMAVLTFVFTQIFRSPIPNFPLFLLCGLVPFNFFSSAWNASTTSIVDNANLIKRVPFPREIIPIASVLATTVHLAAQIGLIFAMVLIYGKGINIYWLWLPVVWGLTMIFVCGLGLICSGLDVYLRDLRYVVESTLTVTYWLVPTFYDFSIIPTRYREIYQLNPIAALVLAQRNIFLYDKAPPETLLWKLAISSFAMFGIGLLVFQKLKRKFYNYL